MDRKIKVLIVEDVPADAELEIRELARAGINYDSELVDNETDLRRTLAEFVPDIVLSDFSFAGTFDGQKALTVVREIAPNTPFIFVSGTIGEERAIDSIKRGATDYVLKTNLERLSTAVLRAIEEAESRRRREAAEEDMSEQWLFFRKIIDIDTNMLFVKDRQGRFVLVNEAVAKIFGTTVENMVGKTNADFISDAGMVERYYRDELDVIESQQEKFFPEVEIRDAEGRTRWLQTILRPISSADGMMDMVLGSSAEITERKLMEDDLRNNVERFEIISRTTNDAVWDWDLTRDQIWWNAVFTNLFGYETGKEGTNIEFWSNLLHPDDRKRVNDSMQEFFNSNRGYWSEEYRFRRYDGSYAYIHDRGYVIRDNAGRPVRMMGAMMDITDRHEQEIRIARLHRIRDVTSSINYMIVRERNSEMLFNGVCRIAHEQGGFALAWIGMLDQDRETIQKVASYGDDKGFLEMARFSRSAEAPEGRDLIGRALRENRSIISDNIATTDGMAYKNELLERGFRSFAILPLSIDDETRGVFTLYSRDSGVFDAEEMKLLKDIASNISFALEHIDKETRLNFLAYYDVLTGLPNEDLFNDRINQALRTSGDVPKLGLLLIDIDRFGYINDAFGRHAGDALLRDVAGMLQRTVTDQDHVARIGADSFAVLLTDLKDAPALARFLEEKLMPALAAPLMVGEQQLNLSVKAGAAVTPEDGLDSETLLKNAEAALKTAKASSDKYKFYTRSMNALVSEKLTLESKLRQALVKDEFLLFYQPKLDFQKDTITGLEALIRWNSEDGLIAPDKFIPILETTGLIVDVGLWVIERAICDYQDWLEKGMAVPSIAINISATQLKSSNFVEQVSSILEKYDDMSSRLEMEITETVIMEDFDINISKLHALRKKGISISIDDFGTGYSSLRYMSKLPVNSLKIDRSFISNLVDNAEDQAIVSAIISLAHSLHLKVVAEGVETAEQAKLLRELNCDEFQGYLFSPPVPFKDVISLLQDHRCCAESG